MSKGSLPMRQALWLMQKGALLSTGHDPRRTTAWLEHGNDRPSITMSTFDAMLRRNWIEEIPRKPKQPYWRNDYRLTALGKRACGETVHASP